jgi:hypothetical protein
MPDPEERDPQEVEEEVEVIAHSDEDDEELAGCYYNHAVL